MPENGKRWNFFRRCSGLQFFGARALARFTPKSFQKLKRPEGRAPKSQHFSAGWLSG
jgi:hypothetical protein